MRASDVMEYMEYKAHIQIPAAWHSMHNKMRALLVSVRVTVHGWNKELPWIHQEDGIPGRTASRVPQTGEEMMRKKRHQWQLEKVAEIKKDYQWLEKTGQKDRSGAFIMAAQEQIHEGGSVPQQTGIKLCQCALGKVQMQGGTASRRNHVATVVYGAIMG